MKKLYAAILMIAMISAITVFAVSAEDADAASEATIICYVDDSIDSSFSYKSTVDVSAYYLTGTLGSTSPNDYQKISTSSTITDSVNVYKIILSNIDTSDPLDASKVYICFDIENYTVSTVQTEFFDLSKTAQIIDSDNKRIFTLYNLSSKFTTIQGDSTYVIGSDDTMSAGVNFTYAEGTITGNITGPEGEKIVGAEVSVTDTTRNRTATAVTDTNGDYSLTFYTGSYKLKINASHYNLATPDAHFYDDRSYDASKNVQAELTLTKESTSATLIGYISNTNGKNFDKVTSIDIALYYQKGTEYELLSSTNTVETHSADSNTYYTFTLSNIPYKSADKCYLYVNMTGYSVGMVQTDCLNPEPQTLVISKSAYVAYRFNESMFSTGYFEPGSSYKIGSEKMPGIQMKDAKGTISGKVTTDTSSPAALNGVTISIYDVKTNALIASGITSDNGSYSVICSTGYYKLTASINDYKTYSGYVTIYDDNYNPELNIQPDIRLSPSEALFGTDLPHVLMVVGLIVALVLIIIVLIHRLRFFGKKLNIYEDEKEEEK